MSLTLSKRYRNLKSDYQILSDMIKELEGKTRISEMDNYPQHGSTSCLMHCIGVAYMCIKLTHALPFTRFEKKEMVRAALLHDYFLYDWHDPQSHELPHAGNHASVALRNASELLELTEREKNMIESHMFPISFSKYPKYRESVVLIVSDKICALYETLRRHGCYRGHYLEEILVNSGLNFEELKHKKEKN